MNKIHLKFICGELQLGLPIGITTSVFGSRGGSFVWKVNTPSGGYAIKQLAPVIDITDEKIIAKYELSERIADKFLQNGISAISAIKNYGKHLILIENIGYLVYPWIDGVTLTPDKVSEYHAIKIAEIIAKIHKINLSISEVKPAYFDIHSNEKIIGIINKSIECDYPFANNLKENQNFILSINDNYQSIIPSLQENTVITHGDLDPLNVLWNKENEPTLIDWESARRLNLTRDIVRTCLAWSGGMRTESTALQIYTRMLNRYIKVYGELNINQIEAALRSVYGSQINWLIYNLELFFNNNILQEKNKVTNEINTVLITMKNFEIKIQKLLEIL